uniref:acireductone dioxygenase (Fe(2+)-requiring) n=2 Tax=Ixodes scapularis TaxID=6945 RepID=A0A1S4LA90_IXOSC
EHKHTIEEIRYVERGVDWLDVRDIRDNWVRIEMTTGDMAILPSNTYHRAVFRQVRDQ